MSKEQSIKELMKIPSIGKSIANDLWNIGITSSDDLKNKDPQILYSLSNEHAGVIQDRCLLYCFRCAVYYVNTDPLDRIRSLLLWWNHKDHKK